MLDGYMAIDGASGRQDGRVRWAMSYVTMETDRMSHVATDGCRPSHLVEVGVEVATRSGTQMQ